MVLRASRRGSSEQSFWFDKVCSGTILIAAERVGRAARLFEFDPAYCDVIVRRFEAFTGKKGVLEQNINAIGPAG